MDEGMTGVGGSGLARGGSGGVGDGGGGLTDVARASNDMMNEAGAVLLHQVDEAARARNGRVDDGDLLVEILGDGSLFVGGRERDVRVGVLLGIDVLNGRLDNHRPQESLEGLRLGKLEKVFRQYAGAWNESNEIAGVGAGAMQLRLIEE